MQRLLYILIIFLLVNTANAQKSSVLLPIKENGKWGFIDRTGKMKIAPAFDLIGDFKGSYAIVKKKGLFYLIDSSNTYLLKDGYTDIQFLNDEYLAVKRDKFALANLTDTIYSPFYYSFIKEEKLNTILLKTDSLTADLFNTITHKFLSGNFDQVTVDPKENFIEIKKGNKVGLLDSLHQWLLLPIEGNKAFREKGIVFLKKEEGLQVFSSQGKMCGDTAYWKSYRVHSPYFVEVWNHPARKFILATSSGKQFPFDKFSSCEALGPFLIAIKEGKKGLLNEKGEFIVAIGCERIDWVDDQTIRLYKGIKTGVVSLEGKTLFPVEYDYIDKFNEDGIAMAENNGRVGILSRNGKILAPCKYDQIDITAEGWKCYQNNSMDLYTLLGPAKVDEILHFNNVSTVHISKQRQRKYEFRNTIDPVQSTNLPFRTSSKGNYNLTSIATTYPANARLACLITKNYMNVEYLYGVIDVANKRTIAYKKHWDIQIDEFEEQEYARIILSGDRQALLGKRGDIKSMFPIMKNGRTVLTPATYIGPFVNGLARINIGGTFISGDDIKEKGRATFSMHSLSCNGGKWGYINGNGELIIKPELEYASDFYKGRAIVKRDGFYGVIDSLEQYIIKPQYGEITYLKEADGKYFKLVNRKSESGLLNDEGKIIMKAEYQSFNYWNESLIPVKNGGLYGAFDFSGRQIIPFRYEHLTPFYEGKAAFKEKNKWGFVDTLGNVILSPEYSETNCFNSGLAPVKQKSLWGFVDPSGKFVIPAKYNRAQSFKDGVAAVYANKKWFYIDRAGKKISSHKFSRVGEFDKYGLAIVSKKKRNYVLKSNGKLLTHTSYKKIYPFSDGLSRVKTKKNKWGFIDTTGKMAVPAIYSSAQDYHEGLAPACLASKWGYIDNKNNVKIPFEYHKVEIFSEGKATVISNKSTFVIDTAGNKMFALPEKTLGVYKEGLIILNNTYYNQQGMLEFGPFGNAMPFVNGIAKVQYKKYQAMDHLIDRKNNLIAAYPSISVVKNHLSTFTIHHRIGLADMDGKIISAPIYQSIEFVGDGIFKIGYFDEVGYLNKYGTWLWTPKR